MILVDCIEKYWEFVRLIRTDPHNKNFFLTKEEITPKQQIEFMKKNSHRYKICLLDNTPVGYIGIKGENEITYCVDPSYQGKGIGTFMLGEFTKSHKTLTAFVYPENKASNKVFEKLGFKRRNFWVYNSK